MKIEKKNNILIYSIQILIWIIVFAFPFIIQERNENYELTTKGILIYSIIPLTFLLTFYLNTLILIPQILFRNSKLGYVFANLIMITIFSLCINQVQKQVPPPINKEFHKYNPKKDSDIELQHSKIDTFENQIFKRVNKKPAKELNYRPRRPKNIYFILRDALTLIFIACIAATIKMSEKWSRAESSLKVAEKEKSEAELDNLKSQINPHFLLNTLNNIYSLIVINPTHAQDAIHKLSKLLRYVLYDNKVDFIELKNEIEFIKNYIELMKIRVSMNCKIETDFTSIENPDVKIAPLLFISLVENAFKHGISNKGDSFIRISLKEANNRVEFIAENSYFPKDSLDKSGSGIGLNQVKKRLEILYPNKYKWQYGINYNTYYSKLYLDI